jgi:hypothetical protein
VFRRAGHRGVARRANDGAPPASPMDQILAFGPAQWIRFTSENVTLNGGSISAAADLSPNARNVSQGTASLQAAFANPGANFDGTDDYFASATAYLHGVASFSIFSVFDLAGETLSNSNGLLGLDNGATDYLYIDFGVNTRLEFRANVGNVAANSGIAISGATGRRLIDARAISGSVRVWDGGVQGVETTTAFASTVANVAPKIGASLITRAFPGTIQDGIVFTPALSLADQAVVRALLAQLDGVTL